MEFSRPKLPEENYFGYISSICPYVEIHRSYSLLLKGGYFDWESKFRAQTVLAGIDILK